MLHLSYFLFCLSPPAQVSQGSLYKLVSHNKTTRNPSLSPQYPDLTDILPTPPTSDPSSSTKKPLTMAQDTSYKQHSFPSLNNPPKPLDPTTLDYPQSTVPSTTITTKTVIYSLPNRLSRLNKSERTTLPQNPQPQKKAVATHLLGKSLSNSAILEFSSCPFIQEKEKEKTVRVARESQRAAVLGKDKGGVRLEAKGEESEKRWSTGFGGEVGIGAKGGKVSKDECKGEESEEGQKSLDVHDIGGGGGGGRAVGGVRSRFFAGAQVELGDFFVKSGVRVVSVDMPPFMQIRAVSCARKTCDSLEKFTFKALAFTLKKEFDGVYGPAWHCIVGKSFGSFVTHSVGGFLYFSMDQKFHILLFKTTVQVTSD